MTEVFFDGAEKTYGFTINNTPYTRHHSRRVTTMESEAIALLEALKQAVKENHLELHIQGDSKNIISMVLGSSKPPKPLRPIFSEISTYLDHLEYFKINWVSREENKADGISRVPSS